jgi:opacity protein-like surface antigen
VGESFNKSNKYKTNVPPFITFTPVFSNHTTNSFSYKVGLGIDVDMSTDWRFGVGYRFTDFGKARLGNGVIDTVPTSSHLSQSHLHVNEVVAQLTYLMTT